MPLPLVAAIVSAGIAVAKAVKKKIEVEKYEHDEYMDQVFKNERVKSDLMDDFSKNEKTVNVLKYSALGLMGFTVYSYYGKKKR